VANSNGGARHRPEKIREKKEAPMSDEKAEKALLAALEVILAEHPDYQKPQIRSDGDILIPLDPVLKKNRAAHRNVAEAISDWMARDGKTRRSSTWIE
jgi:hypothetical protein